MRPFVYSLNDFFTCRSSVSPIFASRWSQWSKQPSQCTQQQQVDIDKTNKTMNHVRAPRKSRLSHIACTERLINYLNLFKAEALRWWLMAFLVVCCGRLFGLPAARQRWWWWWRKKNVKSETIMNGVEILMSKKDDFPHHPINTSYLSLRHKKPSKSSRFTFWTPQGTNEHSAATLSKLKSLRHLIAWEKQSRLY